MISLPAPATRLSESSAEIRAARRALRSVVRMNTSLYSNKPRRLCVRLTRVSARPRYLSKRLVEARRSTRNSFPVQVRSQEVSTPLIITNCYEEFLQQKSGTKEGQVQMIREGDGSVTAHTWSSAAQEWINVIISRRTSDCKILTDAKGWYRSRRSCE